MPERNDLGTAPRWTPHRIDLTAADGAATTKKAEGVNAEGFSNIAVDVSKVDGPITDLDVEVLFWSEISEKFVSEDAQITKTNHTDSFQFVFDSMGRIFWVMVTALTGTTPKVSVYVSGRPDR